VNVCRSEFRPLVGMEVNEPDKCLKTLERVKGIEPSYSAWKSRNLIIFTTAVLTCCSSSGSLRLLQNFPLLERRRVCFARDNGASKRQSRNALRASTGWAGSCWWSQPVDATFHLEGEMECALVRRSCRPTICRSTVGKARQKPGLFSRSRELDPRRDQARCRLWVADIKPNQQA
jgi:hypothetical protein